MSFDLGSRRKLIIRHMESFEKLCFAMMQKWLSLVQLILARRLGYFISYIFALANIPRLPLSLPASN